MLNSSRLVMNAENGLWIEDDDFRVIKAYSSSPRESETTLFLWKNNLSPYEKQKTYGRIARNSPFLENLKVVEGLIERLQRRRNHIRSILQTNGFYEGPLSFSDYRETPALQSCPNLDSTSTIERNERGVSRIAIRSRPESLALPYYREPSLKQKIASSNMLPPTVNNVHSSDKMSSSVLDETHHEIESISTEYASSILPIDVDDRGSHHFFSSLEDDSLVFSQNGEEEGERRAGGGRRSTHRSTPAAHMSADENSLPLPSGKTLPFNNNNKKKNNIVDQRCIEHGVKTQIQDAFYHSTEIIDVDSPYNSEEDENEGSRRGVKNVQHQQQHHKSYRSTSSNNDYEYTSERGSSSDIKDSSFIKSFGNYTPVYNTEDRSVWTPFSSLYSKYFDTSTTSSKGEIQKLF